MNARLARRSAVAALPLLATLMIFSPQPAHGQFQAPCGLRCALALGGTAYVVGTSALVAWGRATGGVSTSKEAALVWGTGFAIIAGSGVALSGNGARQERTIYGAGLGTLAGSIAGLAVGLSHTGGQAPRAADRARLVAAAVIGAGAGALAGGIYGALSHSDQGPTSQLPLFTIRWTH